MPFRKLPLPSGTKGEVYLHSMPGRNTRYRDDVSEIADRLITAVVRLTSDRETARKSPEYWEAVKGRAISWQDLRFEISDYGVPEDSGAFVALIDLIAEKLSRGERLLVHCAAGIGRTGTVACAILVRLGVGLDEAVRIVGEAGSYAEAEQQRNFLKDYAGGILKGNRGKRA